MPSLVENEDPEEFPSFLTESESHLSSQTVLRLTKEKRLTCYSPFFFYHLFLLPYFSDIGDWTQGFAHATQDPYHKVTHNMYLLLFL